MKKKIIYVIGILLLNTMSYSQAVAQNNANNKNISKDTTVIQNPFKLNISPSNHESTVELEALTNKKFSFNSWDMMLSVISNQLVINGGMNMNTPESKGERNISAWFFGGGYNYRYRLIKGAYIDLRACCDYVSSSYEIVTGSEEETKVICGKEYTYENDIWSKKNSSGLKLLLDTKIGIEIYKGCYINLGYDWGFNKLKFNKQNRSNGFTLGLNIISL